MKIATRVLVKDHGKLTAYLRYSKSDWEVEETEEPAWNHEELECAYVFSLKEAQRLTDH